MVSLMYQKLAALEQESDYTTADKVLDILLLSPGDPPDWGDNVSEDPVSLGLADQNSLRSQVLDPRKVARLHGNSSGYISPTKARTLLGLRRTYHFSLTMRPVLNVEVSGNGTFVFTVRNSKGLLAPNVNITAYYVPESLVPGDDYPSSTNITRIDGTCALTFQFEADHVLVIRAEQLGVGVTVTHPSGYSFMVEGGRVFASEALLISELVYSTGLVSGIDKETVSRFVEVGGSTYLLQLELWG